MWGRATRAELAARRARADRPGRDRCPRLRPPGGHRLRRQAGGLTTWGGARMAATYDAIVVGGGHNGLVSAAYLARAGARTVVLESRHKTGGAATTEAPWPDAPDHKVTRLSYVMSLFPPS